MKTQEFEIKEIVSIMDIADIGMITDSDQTVRAAESERNPVKKLWMMLGPGIVTGAADDDPSGIGTYSMAGASFGFATLWIALPIFPMMSVVQYICAKIGMVTGMGLADVMRENYSRKLLYAAVVALFIANTINAGADLGAMAAALNLLMPQLPVWFLILPLTAIMFSLQLYGSYNLIAKVFKWLTLALFAYVAAAFFVHLNPAEVFKGTFVPTIKLDAAFLSTLVAIIGTTISPYLLFWQADQEVEEEISSGNKHLWQRKGTTKRRLQHRALDVCIGMLFATIGMYFIILTTGATLFKAGIHNIGSVAEAASALRPLAGNGASLLFALGIIGTGFLAVPILSASASYAVCQAFGWKHGFRRRFVRARCFYRTIAVSMLVGMLMNFLGINPISALFWTAVLNGVLAPPILFMVMLISNNRKIMGRHTNCLAVNVIGFAAVAVMLVAAVAMFVTLQMPVG